MLNKVYRTMRPGLIQVKYTSAEPKPGEVLLRPLFLSVCKADSRYYFGGRAERVLRQKLPMALIHECSAEVIYDPSGKFKEGQAVVPVPTIGAGRGGVYANYLAENSFCSSGMDGFLQDYIVMPAENVIPLPENIGKAPAAYTESVSTGAHAVKRLISAMNGRARRIGIWGDGNVGYGAALMARLMLPEAHLTVFGTHDEKLSAFSFADEVYNVNSSFPPPAVDAAIECVGGAGSQSALLQIIDVISPQGAVALMGVSENNVPINTRLVLEKGITLIGSSRSTAEDFETVLSLVSSSSVNVGLFENLLGRTIEVRTAGDIHRAFAEDKIAPFGKTVMQWNT